ncbi:protein ALTERED PHOSPHATE STARVATION RESPONSE 1-like isoform X2 [Malania oleifera]|uniref:protein ALTERED PHOSPHATE STARVATION RESPONSE 1-like isoform X2 n=1 Tax=Malania oleifera TaxID=397392 RepID=UPI0025AEAFFF|nr:protein ALTERED PHOSPHATE STARVATION RESPONSE 1-like isoform X2 [Malania oleifera]
MGCNASKLDDLPAVALCRDRCTFLADAIHHRSVLANAHVAYLQSLRRVGPALRRLFDQPCDHSPPQSNGDPPPPPPPAAAPGHSHRIHSSSDSESSHHSTSSSPLHTQIQNDFVSDETLNYSKNQPLPSATYSYPNYFDYSSQNGGFDGSFASSIVPRPVGSKSPPPPPAPTVHSPWDFLNLFESYDRYELAYPSNRSSKEGAQEEEAVANSTETQRSRRGESVAVEEDVDREPEIEVPVVDKNVITDKEESKEGKVSNSAAPPSVSDVKKEIEILLLRASECGDEVSKMLEVGKLLYPQKNAVSQVSSKMLQAIYPSSPSIEKIGSINLNFDDEAAGMSSRNLSSTMRKLYVWEKKLYDEVKGEEKLRMIHEKKCKQLKVMDEKGADAHKVESTQTLIMTLSTKIRIAIQVADKISITINKLRDEELRPQIKELIHGLIGMWKSMLECHRSLCQAAAEAKILNSIASKGKLSDDSLEAVMQLKLELQNWNLSFSNWTDSQKGYIKSLNGWLLRCFFYGPEQTPDGLASSPSSIDAPPVFVICSQWLQVLERLLQNEVTEAMQVFFVRLNELFEQHNVDMHQRMMADKDMERRVKSLEREEQKIQKLIQARDKKMGLAATGSSAIFLGTLVHPTDSSDVYGLHSGLKQIFEVMERFMDNSAQAYEELCLQINNM